ncbi:hybrid sensor histidine kinase/response regulator [Anaeromyxobacter diazotrophicus]|uniref:hybrid sensor histidine kinase/response regulator n=1 Tax=Anaeromyxobacter diazotrophicus TaxID=2590199 RepID=UPI00158FC470|nr:PAS domain-containing hybrid sensor histidine kinase/response regulator [Anaeromyxobacter diazotrophicus]
MRETSQRAAWGAVLALCSAAVVVAAWRYDRRLERELWAAAADHLAAEASLGAKLIAAWRDERSGDMAVLAVEPILGAAAGGAFPGEALEGLLRAAAARYRCRDIALVRRDGSLAFSLSGRGALDEGEARLVGQAVQGRDVATTALRAGAGGDLTMQVAAALPEGGAVLALAEARATLLPQLAALAAARPALELAVVRPGEAGAELVMTTRGPLAGPTAANPREALWLALGRRGAVVGAGPGGARLVAVGAPVAGSELTAVALLPEAEVLGPRRTARAALLFSLASFAALAAAAASQVLRRRREQIAALRSSGERLDAALQASGAGVWELDVPTGHVQPTASWNRVLGYAPDELQEPADFEALVHPEDAPARRAAYAALLEGRAPCYDVELRYRRKDGAYQWMHSRGVILRRDAQGRPLRVVGTSVDVTEQRRLREQLLLSERLASVGTLAAGVAHELNNPLAYVATNLDYALGELSRLAERPGAGFDAAELARVAPEVLAALREASDGAARLRVIVADVRAFARSPRREDGPVELARVIASAVNMARHELKHRARVVTELDPVPPVRGDAGRLGQVVLNLLVNAAHAIPEGRVDANEVRITVRPAPGGRVALAVRDSGRGISPEVLPRLFEPFFTTDEGGGGTGLGLAICHRIVTELGGAIGAESTPGQGSTFTVLLPQAAPSAGTTPAPVAADGGEPRSRVLVVDDDPLVARAVERALARRHQVTVVASGLGALAAVERERFDVVVSDVLMPEMTGLELQRELARAAPRLARGMVFVTGALLDEAARRQIADSGSTVVEKPFTPAQLLRAVDEALAAGGEPAGGPRARQAGP